jgi:hypothetical protein
MPWTVWTVILLFMFIEYTTIFSWDGGLANFLPGHYILRWLKWQILCQIYFAKIKMVTADLRKLVKFWWKPKYHVGWGCWAPPFTEATSSGQVVQSVAGGADKGSGSHTAPGERTAGWRMLIFRSPVVPGDCLAFLGDQLESWPQTMTIPELSEH